VVAFALAMEVAPFRPKNTFHVGRVVCHFASDGARRAVRDGQSD
jgi:hypothetical protein